MKTLLNFFIENWPTIAPIVYEILVRIWPTKWNLSILDNAWKLLNSIIPNKRIPDGNESGLGTNAAGKVVNQIRVPIGKHILRALLIVCLFNTVASAQIWQNFKGIRSVNESDTTQQLAVEGSFYYDEDAKVFYGRNQWGWKEFSYAGAGGNFWPLEGSGAFTDDVVINMQNHGFVQQGSGTYQITSGGGVTIFSGVASDATFGGNNVKLLSNPDGIISFSEFDEVRFDANTNSFLITNEAQTHTTSIFGGEIQIDDPTASDDVTFNTSGIQVTGVSNYEINTASGTLELDANIILAPNSTASQLYGGEFTPTYTNIGNTNSATAQTTHFFRIGDYVIVNGSVSVTPTLDGTVTEFYSTLPVASNIAAAGDVVGSCHLNSTFDAATAQNGVVTGQVAENGARFSFTSSTAATAVSLKFTYSYKIL